MANVHSVCLSSTATRCGTALISRLQEPVFGSVKCSLIHCPSPALSGIHSTQGCRSPRSPGIHLQDQKKPSDTWNAAAPQEESHRNTDHGATLLSGVAPKSSPKTHPWPGRSCKCRKLILDSLKLHTMPFIICRRSREHWARQQTVGMFQHR